MSSDACRSACPTRDHKTYGECLRAAHIAIDRTALASGRVDPKEKQSK